MRMIQPSPGEAMDRQSILELKMEYGQAKKINIVHFQGEHEVLQAYLERAWFPNISAPDGMQVNALYQQLRDINRALWILEDQARELLPQLVNAAHEVLVRASVILASITNLNDERAARVATINKLFKVDTPEKLHS